MVVPALPVQLPSRCNPTGGQREQRGATESIGNTTGEKLPSRCNPAGGQQGATGGTGDYGPLALSPFPNLREFACLTTVILAPLRVEPGLHGRSVTSVASS